jgi:phospholipid/cholesterol/gamma-HCH transport system ATP-binding protein
MLGPSGTGKSVLLKTLIGLLKPDRGSVVIEGVDITSCPEKQLYEIRKLFGVLFQDGAMFGSMNLYDNVAFPLREHTDLDESMIRDIVLMKLNAVGLRGAAYLRISEISGGMARRVALARAIALDPELLMYDEPFAGLDPISMAIAANLIRTLNDTTGATSILVSHDVQQCFKICDYAYLMSSQGKVVAQGTPKQLNGSEDPEVRQFIRGEPDGPVRFHFPAKPLAEDFGVPA